MSCDFSYDHYGEILHLSQEMNYRFMGCNSFINCDKKGNIIVMRHDVDAHPNRAYDIAQLEFSAGVHSTFFFRVFSNSYNLFGYDTMEIVREIEKMGHEIGYHAEPVDVSAAMHWEISPQRAFHIGKEALELIVGHKVLGVASHREATGFNNLKQFFEMKSVEELDIGYEAYDSSNLNLFNNAHYITDGYEWYWRSFVDGKKTEDCRCICEIIKEKKVKTIYCLTHPNSWYLHHYHRVLT